MPAPSEVFAALAHAKGIGASELARGLGISRQHAHRLLRGERDAGARAEELERLLALGPDDADSPTPLFAVAALHDELDLLTAGGTQPLFERRSNAERAAELVDDPAVAVVPVWRSYAWRRLVRAYAVWGAEPEPRNVFVVDAAPDLPLDPVLRELAGGLRTTLDLLRRGGAGAEGS
jgi:transcriptional regulator with XRE-family HTH domain